MPVVGVAPKPGGQCLAFIGVDTFSGDPFICLSLRGEQTIKIGHGKFAGIPRVIGPDLRIADVTKSEGEQPHQQ